MPNKNDDVLMILNQEDFSNRDISFLFSEIRKMIEAGETQYKTLKFYCDWLLHAQKDRFHPEMKQYIKEIYEFAVKHIKNPMHFEYSKKIGELIYFEELKKDLDKILSDTGMPKKILEEETWLNLIRVIVKLLEDQPLKNPIDEVTSIVFAPSAEGAAILFIYFSQPVLDRNQKHLHHYNMGNFY
jgi:hypothetical protein